MEEQGLERLINNTLKALGQGDYHKVYVTKRSNGKGQLLNQIGTLVKLSCNNPNLSHIFSFEDLDSNDIKDYSQRYIQNVPEEFRKMYIPIFAKHEIETWIMSDIKALEKHGLVHYTDYQNPEDEINSTKKPSIYLDELFRANGLKYKKTSDGVALLDRLDVETVYKKCPSFKFFVDKITEIINCENPFSK